MLNRFTAFILFLLLSGHVYGQINSAEVKLEKLLNKCIEKQFSETTTPSLNAELDLLEVCPDLSIFLATYNKNDFIQPKLKSETTLNRLIDERALRQQPYRTLTSNSTDLGLVATLAKNYNLDSSKIITPSLWQRLKQWLKENYGSKDEDAGIDWILKLLDGFSIPDWLYKSILYGSIGLVIILAIFIIVNEFRQYKRYKNREQFVTTADTLLPIHELRMMSWDEIQTLPVHQKTSALLQYLIQQCINRQWLVDNNSFTNQEFYRQLKKQHTDKALQFKQVIMAAEKDIYGNHSLSDEELANLMRITQSVLAVEEPTSS